MGKNPATGQNFQVYLLLFLIGLIIFFAVTFTFSFRDKVFQAFFQRPLSLAQVSDDTPEVSLIAGVDNIFRIGVINVEDGKSNIALRWKTENSPKSCLGRFWSNVKGDSGWAGEKNTGGGDYVIAENLSKGIYVYSISCSNEFGDSSGSSMTINVGAKQTNLKPHITFFQVLGDGNQYELGRLNQVNQNTKLEISWSSVNTQSSYGVCVASGSWPTIYQNAGSLTVKESFVLEEAKIYKYSLFCSNESGYDSQEISFVTR